MLFEIRCLPLHGLLRHNRRRLEDVLLLYTALKNYAVVVNYRIKRDTVPCLVESEKRAVYCSSCRVCFSLGRARRRVQPAIVFAKEFRLVVVGRRLSQFCRRADQDRLHGDLTFTGTCACPELNTRPTVGHGVRQSASNLLRH